MGILWLVIIAGVIYLIYNQSQQNTGQNRRPDKLEQGHDNEGKKRAVDIARERLARGEISKEEFQEIKDEIENS
ncbi:MAG: SHOCT domain-containing protein [Bacillota bacterium]